MKNRKLEIKFNQKVQKISQREFSQLIGNLMKEALPNSCYLILGQASSKITESQYFYILKKPDELFYFRVSTHKPLYGRYPFKSFDVSQTRNFIEIINLFEERLQGDLSSNGFILNYMDFFILGLLKACNNERLIMQQSENYLKFNFGEHLIYKLKSDSFRAAITRLARFNLIQLNSNNEIRIATTIAFNLLKNFPEQIYEKEWTKYYFVDPRILTISDLLKCRLTEIDTTFFKVLALLQGKFQFNKRKKGSNIIQAQIANQSKLYSWRVPKEFNRYLTVGMKVLVENRNGFEKVKIKHLIGIPRNLATKCKQVIRIELTGTHNDVTAKFTCWAGYPKGIKNRQLIN